MTKSFSKIDENLLNEISSLHTIPQGAYNIRKNGQSVARKSTKDVEITPKTDKQGIDIVIHKTAKQISVHIPVILSESGMQDKVYNDFYVEEGANVLIVAGCGIHSTGSKESLHEGIHSFHIAKNAQVTYVEKHLGLGTGKDKVLHPTTHILMEENSTFTMQTIQLGGVTLSNRDTTALLKNGAKLIVEEKILTNHTDCANTKFQVTLNGKDASCDINSRSVAKENSSQSFLSNVIGNAQSFAHVACDGIMVGQSRISSTPALECNHVDARLVHEAAIGKIAGEELTKLMTLGLSYEEAENLIIKGFLS